MRLMKMMNYDFKAANYWQHNVSDIIDHKLCSKSTAVYGCYTMFLHHSASSSSDASEFRQ